jgi:hypothetical protein
VQYPEEGRYEFVQEGLSHLQFFGFGPPNVTLAYVDVTPAPTDFPGPINLEGELLPKLEAVAPYQGWGGKGEAQTQPAAAAARPSSLWAAPALPAARQRAAWLLMPRWQRGAPLGAPPPAADKNVKSDEINVWRKWDFALFGNMSQAPFPQFM